MIMLEVRTSAFAVAPAATALTTAAVVVAPVLVVMEMAVATAVAEACTKHRPGRRWRLIEIMIFAPPFDSHVIKPRSRFCWSVKRGSKR